MTFLEHFLTEFLTRVVPGFLHMVVGLVWLFFGVFFPLLNRSLSFALHLLFLCHSGNQFCKPLKIDCPSLYHWSCLGWENITSSFSSCTPGVKHEPLTFLKCLSCQCFSSSYFVKIIHRFLKTPKDIHSEGVYFDAAFPWGLFCCCFFFFNPSLSTAYIDHANPWQGLTLIADFRHYSMANNNSHPFFLAGKVCGVTTTAFLALLRSRG